LRESTHLEYRWKPDVHFDVAQGLSRRIDRFRPDRRRFVGSAPWSSGNG
jgi:hypothetical protein